MPELYAAAGGVNRRFVQAFVSTGGVNRDLREIWASSGGANRKIYASGPYVTMAFDEPPTFALQQKQAEDRGTSLYMLIAGRHTGATPTDSARGRANVILHNVPPGATVEFLESNSNGTYYVDSSIRFYGAAGNYLGFASSTNDARTKVFRSGVFPASETEPGQARMNVSIGIITNITMWLEVFEVKIDGVKIFPA